VGVLARKIGDPAYGGYIGNELAFAFPLVVFVACAREIVGIQIHWEIDGHGALPVEDAWLERDEVYNSGSNLRVRIPSLD